MVVAPRAAPPDHDPATEVLVVGEDRDDAPYGRPWSSRVHLMPLVAVAAVLAVVVAVNFPGSWTMSPEPTATPANGYEVAFGTFEPVTVSATGSAEVSLPATWAAGARSGIITVDHPGPGRFELATTNGPSLLRVVHRHLVTGHHLAVRGPYAGTILFGNTFVPSEADGPHAAAGPWSLTVSVGPHRAGPWSVTIAPVSSADQLPATASGAGDDVFLYDGGFAGIHLRHPRPGSAQRFGFAQWTLGRHRGDLPRMAQHFLSPGPSVVAFAAPVGWTVRSR